MAALWRADARLAQRVDEVPDERRLALVATRSGHATAAVETQAGHTFLHSRYDPLADAARLIESTPLADKFGFVVCGMGLGYHVRALYDRLQGDAAVVVLEPSLEVLATALGCVDLTDAISAGRLVILTRLHKAELHERLKPHNTLLMLGVQFVIHPPSRMLADAFHAQARRMITDFIAYNRMTLLTLVGNARITCRNVAHNLPTYLTTPPIDTLRDRFRGYPGIIVASGPSLRRNIDRLADAKGRAVLCSVQTSLKPLLARNIVPDFVTSLDFHAMSRQFFQGLDPRQLADVHLVAEPKVTWHVLDHFRGCVSLLHSQFAELLVGRELAGRDGLKPGATVAHLAVSLAEYMGCDPVIFVGQDLAFTDHCFYIPGVEAHRTWHSELNRFNTLETKEWERIVRNRDILRKVRDVHGREIYTDDLLFTYLEQFERDFLGCNARIIDATEGGAQMRGTELMTLGDAIDRFCTQPLPADAFAYRSQSVTPDTSRLTRAYDEIAARLREIEELEAVCDEMLELLDELQGLVDDAPRFNNKLVRVDELRTAVQRSARAYRIINAGTQMAELQRYTADRKLGAAGAAGPELAKRQLKRDIEYVTRFREGALAMRDILTESLDRFPNAADRRASPLPHAPGAGSARQSDNRPRSSTERRA